MRSSRRLLQRLSIGVRGRWIRRWRSCQAPWTADAEEGHEDGACWSQACCPGSFRRLDRAETEPLRGHVHGEGPDVVEVGVGDDEEVLRHGMLRAPADVEGGAQRLEDDAGLLPQWRCPPWGTPRSPSQMEMPSMGYPRSPAETEPPRLRLRLYCGGERRAAASRRAIGRDGGAAWQSGDSKEGWGSLSCAQ